MQFRALRAELQHVAEHRDAPAARPDRRLAEQRERRAHRGRIGVVALVDQQRRAARHVERQARAAAGRRLRVGERQRRQRQIGAGERRRRQHRERVLHHVAARRAELVGDVVRRGCAPARSSESACSATLDSRASAFACSPNETMRPTPAAFGRASQPRELRIVAVDDRGAARLEPCEDLRLGVGDGLERAEEFQMHRLDRGDDRDMRPHELASAARSRRRGSCRSRTRRSARSRGSARATAARPSDCCRTRPRHGSRPRATARAAAPPWCRSCRPSR